MNKQFPEEHLLVRCEWPSYYDEQHLEYSKQKTIGDEPPISGRAAVDMAVLKMDTQCDDYEEVLALVEFKAHCFLNHEKWPYEEFTEDVAKMYKMTSIPRKEDEKDKRIENAHLYFIMLTSSIGSDISKYSSAVAYKDILDKEGNKRESQQKPTLYNENTKEVFISQLKGFWEGFNKLSFDFSLPEKKVQTPYSLKFIGNVAITDVPEPEINSSGTAFGYRLWQTGFIWGPFTADQLDITMSKL